MPAVPPDDPVVLGKVTEAYGIKGWVRLHAFGDDPLSWKKIVRWWARPERAARAEWRPLVLANARMHGDGVIVRFEGCDDRNAAEALRGCLVAVDRQDLPAPADDEFYWAELIGLAVVTTTGGSLGTVRELIETGANDVLVVESADGQERLLPFVGAVVKEVDRGARVIRVEWDAGW